MAQVFISYRHVEPDQSLAAELANAVGKEHRVFIHNQIPLGRQWGDIIREHLEDADFLTALASQNSAKSPMVLAEIEQAHQLNVAKKRLGIIPIRLRFDVEQEPKQVHHDMLPQHSACGREDCILLKSQPDRVGNGNWPNHHLRRLERRAVTFS